MSGESILPERVRLIFRTLSVLTLIEGAIGFLIAADSFAMSAFYYKSIQHLENQPHPSTGWSIYIVASAGIAFSLLLLYAGGLIWKLERRGLLVLIYALVAEFVYVLVSRPI